MAKFVLSASTEVGEMALFSVDALPQEQPDSAAFNVMEGEGFLIRLRADSARVHVLAAYVDERIPDEVMQDCVVSEAQTGHLRLADGRLGFGGSEALYAELGPDDETRDEDAEVVPGDYEVTVYPTHPVDDSPPGPPANRLAGCFVGHAIGRRVRVLMLLLIGYCALCLGLIIAYFVASALDAPQAKYLALLVFVVIVLVPMVLKAFDADRVRDPLQLQLDVEAVEAALREHRRNPEPTLVAQMWRRGGAGMDGEVGPDGSSGERRT